MLMIKLAQLSANLHGAGLCHRDYYLCHFIIQKKAFNEGQLELILIDLHRMLQNQTHESSAVMKDIAALVFSAKDAGFNDDDWALFKQHYLPLGEQFWVSVEQRAEKLYRKFHSAKFQQRLKAEKSALND
jgi:heptose I phosphotransferase